MIIVRIVFRALPDRVTKNAVSIGRKVDTVPKDVGLRVIADGGRWVALEAVLTRRSAVGPQGAFLPAPFGTAGLEHMQTRKRTT